MWTSVFSVYDPYFLKEFLRLIFLRQIVRNIKFEHSCSFSNQTLLEKNDFQSYFKSVRLFENKLRDKSSDRSNILLFLKPLNSCLQSALGFYSVKSNKMFYLNRFTFYLIKLRFKRIITFQNRNLWNLQLYFII